MKNEEEVSRRVVNRIRGSLHGSSMLYSNRTESIRLPRYHASVWTGCHGCHG